MSIPNDSISTFPAGGDTTGDADTNVLAERARQDLDTIRDEVKDQVGSLKEEATAQLSEVADKARGLAAEQKDLLAGQVAEIVGAMEKVASELEGSGSASAGYVRMIADGAKNVSGALKDNDVDDVLSMAQDFGRRQPAAFMGAAALLGFAASRFVLASASRVAAAAPRAPAPATNGTIGSTGSFGGSNG